MGEFAALASAALWAIASIIFAQLGRRISPVSVNFLKTTSALVALSITLVILEGYVFPPALQGVSLMWVGLSGVIGLAVGDSLYFMALAHIGARYLLVLWALTPAATAILAYLTLGEPITQGFVIGMPLTMVGIGLVLSDSKYKTTEEKSTTTKPLSWLGVLAGLGAVLCQAGGTVTAKMGGQDLSGLELAVVRLCFGGLALLIPLVVQGRFWSVLRVDIQDGVRIGWGTFLGTYLGIWLSMVAVQRAFTGVVATLQATSPLFALFMGRIFFKEPLTLRALLGSMIAVLGVAILTMHRFTHCRLL